MKSVSVGRSPPSVAFSQVHAAVMTVSMIDCPISCGLNSLASREPQEHKLPLGVLFSVLDLSQVHSPAGRAP